MNLELAQRKVRSKNDMHRLLLVEGFVLPRPQSTICTVAFLRAVFDGDMYCPHLSACVHRPVLYPPPIKQLQEDLLGAIRTHCDDSTNDRIPAKSALYQVLLHKQADRDFLLAGLAALDGEHPVLQKNYRPPGRQTTIKQALTVADPDGYLQQMHDLPADRLVKRSTFQFLSKEDRLEQDIARGLARRIVEDERLEHKKNTLVSLRSQ
jgi:hypothetical protein